MPFVDRTADDGTYRFAVESSSSGTVQGPIEFARTHEEAVALYEHRVRERPFVWLAEYGRYRKLNEVFFDWIYYRWTVATDWPVAPGRFQGYPREADDELVDYESCERADAE